jgi:hypothetical protein
MKTTNDTIIGAIDDLIFAATGEPTGIAETWENSNHDTVRLEEHLDWIENDYCPTAPEKQKLFKAARLALEAINEK